MAGPRSSDAEVITLKAIRDALTGEVRPGSPHPDTVPLDPSAAKQATPDPAATKKPDDDPWAGGGSKRAPDTEPILKSPGGSVKEIPSSTPGHPPGKVHADVDEVSAVAIYTRARLDSPHLEVGIYHHPATGRYVVVHGEADRITGDWRKSDPDYAGKWIAVKHFHPGGDDAARLPSHEDFAHLYHNMQRGDKGELVKTVVWVDYTKADGTRLHTAYGYDPAKGGWFVDFINPKTGKSETQSFPKGPWADKNYDKLLRGARRHGRAAAPAPGGPGRPRHQGAQGHADPEAGVVHRHRPRQVAAGLQAHATSTTTASSDHRRADPRRGRHDHRAHRGRRPQGREGLGVAARTTRRRSELKLARLAARRLPRDVPGDGDAHGRGPRPPTLGLLLDAPDAHPQGELPAPRPRSWPARCCTSRR